MRLVITGSDGFIGWHLRCYLLDRPEVDVVLANRETFADPASLADAVEGCDVVVHLAGVNRAEESEVREGNVRLARQLVKACEIAGSPAHIIMASSTHVERQPLTAFGEAKLEAAAILRRWAATAHTPFTELVIPHVFGELARPFYNSAVATFCYQLANGEEPRIVNDSELELLHVQDLCESIVGIAENGAADRVRFEGIETNVSAVLGRLQSTKKSYESGVLPDLDDAFELRLFNSLRSYYYPKRYPLVVNTHRDERGHLFETVKSRSGGQCFVSTTRPGVTRGRHFHRRKFERFFVLSGEATIRIRRLFDSEPRNFLVDGDNPAYVDIPTLHTHEITNTGQDELLTLFWAHEIFDPENPDTYAHPVDETNA